MLINKASYLLFFYILLASPAHANPLKEFCQKLFFKSPRSIEWNVNLQTSCPVSHQGKWGSCWANSGTLILNPILKKCGILPENEFLSEDFYFAKHIENQLDKKINFFDVVEGANLDFFLKYLSKYGVVTRSKYTLPASLRDQSLKKVFFNGRHFLNITKINEISGKKLSYNEIKKIEEQLESNYASNPIESFFPQIIQSLDNQIPVYGVLNPNFNEKGGPDFWGHPGLRIESVTDNQNFAITHAITIIGYKLNKNKELTHLLFQNSKGLTFGNEGVFSADVAFIKKYLLSIRFFNLPSS